MCRQQVAYSQDAKLAFVLVSSTDHVTVVTGITYDQVTVQYWSSGATVKNTYTVTAADWKEAGNGDYALNIGASEFTSYSDYNVSVSAPGCDLVRLQVTTRDMRASDRYGNLLARYTDTNGLAGLWRKASSTTEYETYGGELPAPTTTGCRLSDYLEQLEPGDLMVWGGGGGPYMTVLTSTEDVSGCLWVNWTPALAYAPNDHWPVTFMRNPLHVFGQSYPLSGAESGSLHASVKSVADKLPSGELSDYDEHRSRANVGYDGNTLTINAWLEHRGEVVDSPTGCAVTVHDDAGTELFDLGDESPDAQGVFKLTKTEPGLEAGKSYYAMVEIVSDGNTYRTVEGISTL